MNSRSPEDLLIINARSQLLARGDVPKGVVADTIARSWQRCVSYGLDSNLVDDARLSASELRSLREQNGMLLAHAKPEMETLHEQISSSGSIILLTDANGMILHAMGDDSFLDTATRLSLQEGVSWNESWRGTNAIGTALEEQAPVAVHAAEHFVENHHLLSCSAVPILDAQGQLVGALDVSNDYRIRQPHSLALVRMSAQMIENRLFNASNSNGITLYFHARQEFVGTLWQGIAVFSEDGKLRALNRSGRFQLGLEHQPLDRISFSQLFDQPFSALLSRLHGGMSPLLPLRMENGARVYARMQAPLEQHRIISHLPSRNVVTALEGLNHGDLRLARAIDQVKRVIDRDIPILIEGETGVGKELFAQAIHQSSRRRNKAFVAINCAALPEGLIESELFGYEEGAFTGARRKGSPGKLLQADGGTLFLDEIGDMPLNLQARLLRVLQERRVTPLGGGEAKPVDIAIVSATNRKLGELVNQGGFRSDLYYRLNGLAVTLPPLRERSDLKPLVRHLLDKEEAGHVIFSEEVETLFEAHPWPGNLRQLHTVLRTALALKDEGDELCREHLPQSFLDELGMQPVEAEGSLDKLEAESIRNTLLAHAGNVSSAARQLGISRTTLYRKLRQMGLN
ncbi:Fis family transcriptional regulator [Novimethylophilus kurashikiensis]|uniref:Fis family transcriptional regulator n=1 Tax=Novimethylophilus kurashikiensis TaxID=1825523 RepID=A0A2R5FDN1_9PROT|nr:sigma-54-dependent Fis family transcriptional regulator [Novimethylophilus kurashikiensis]GBG14943.1 Fis family transcriptional regulator [Novimethylophilus kurashikiensis]